MKRPIQFLFTTWEGGGNVAPVVEAAGKLRAGLSLMPDASIEAIRSAGERLLNDPTFRIAATRLGDLVAADAENSKIVEELEAAASR